jgi:hypothetical protein
MLVADPRPRQDAMTDQQPTRFENYPPETPTSPFTGADPSPTPPPVLHAPPVPAERPQRTHTRRNVLVGMLAVLIGGPAVAALGARAVSPAPVETGEAELPIDDDEDSPDDAPYDFTVGGYTAEVPRGWELADGADGGVAVLRRDANQVTVLSWSPGSGSPWPADDITEAVNRAATGFKGGLGKPINQSTVTRAMATLSAKGTFHGEKARQFAELWLDDNDTYLLIITVLTAAEGSAIARQATDVAWGLTSGLR